jgi:fucose permease
VIRAKYSGPYCNGKITTQPFEDKGVIRMFRGLEKNTRRLYVVLLFNFMLFGISLSIISASVPQIIRTYNWSYTLTGLILAAGSIGYFLSTFLCGFLVHHFAPKKVLLAGLVIEALGLFFFARWAFYLANLILIFLIGFGQGAMEVISNYEVIKIEKPGESRLMSLMHAFFCLGAIIGPLGVGSLIQSGLSWNLIFRIVGFLVVCMGISVLIVPFIRQVDIANGEENEGVRVLAQPLLLLFFFILLLYVGSEFGVSNWISEYFVKVLQSSVATGAFMVSILWIGIFAGRFFISAIRWGLGQELILLFLTSSCTIFLLFAILNKNAVSVAVFTFFTGLGYSGIYPVVMAMVGKNYKNGVAVGFASTGGGIGSFSFPFVTAIIADAIGLRRGFIFFVFLNALMIGLSLVVAKKAERFEPAP